MAERSPPFFTPDRGKVTAMIKVEGDAPLSSVTAGLNTLEGAQITEVAFTDMFEKDEGRETRGRNMKTK